MKKRIVILFTCLCALCHVYASGAVSAERSISSAITASLPQDYIMQKTGPTTIEAYSPDKKTQLHISLYDFDKLPSGWEDPQDFDKNVMHLDTLQCLSNDHSYFWQLNKSYCTRAYQSDRGVIYSDSRCIYPGLMINTVFIDYSAAHKEVFDTYLSTMHSNESLWGKIVRIYQDSKWFWIIAAVMITIYGAVNHDKSEIPFDRYLKMGGVVGVITGLVLTPLMFGEWIVIGICMVIAFLLTFLSSLYGVHLDFD